MKSKKPKYTLPKSDIPLLCKTLFHLFAHCCKHVGYRREINTVRQWSFDEKRRFFFRDFTNFPDLKTLTVFSSAGYFFLYVLFILTAEICLRISFYYPVGILLRNLFLCSFFLIRVKYMFNLGLSE